MLVDSSLAQERNRPWNGWRTFDLCSGGVAHISRHRPERELTINLLDRLYNFGARRYLASIVANTFPKDGNTDLDLHKDDK